MRKRLALALALALALTGCAGERKSGTLKPGECVLWFTAAHGSPDSAALSSEVRTVESGDTPLKMLLRGPESIELTSPFPAGTELREYRSEEGAAYVDLSEAYGGLSGAELTLADACVVLTLCQFDEVDKVYITVEGEPRPYRDQVLSPDDFLLDNSLGGTEEPDA